MNSPPTPTPDTEHPFAQYIRILGKGKTGSRSLTRAEAHAAFSMILSSEAKEIQVGAFLMLLRVKEEAPEELAGFVDACRERATTPPEGLSVDLDWASYAGKKHQHPWFILSLLLLAGAGYRIFVHGSAGHTPGRLYTEHALRALGLPVATNWMEVAGQIESVGMSYLALEHFCLPLQGLMQLRPLLGLRSPVNTLARMLNPLRAHASAQSIFHPAYALLHQQADHLLGQPRALVFKGESGEVEIKPQADTRIYLLADAQSREYVLPRTLRRKIPDVSEPSVGPLKDLWAGCKIDQYGLQATLATTSAALLVLEPDLTLVGARQKADTLWQARDLARLR